MDSLLKIIVIGDSTVGKTSLIHRYVQDRFHWNYKPTIGVDFSLKEVCVDDGTKLKVQLWDIAGQDHFSSMTRVYYKDSHACVLMCDITETRSFHNVVKWKADLDSKYIRPDGNMVPCVLLANKCDLNQRAVQEADLQNMCTEYGFLAYFIVSVKSGENVENAMSFLLERVYLESQLSDYSFVDDHLTTSYEHIDLRETSCAQSASRCFSCSL